jgi:hypothetical protein
LRIVNNNPRFIFRACRVPLASNVPQRSIQPIDFQQKIPEGPSLDDFQLGRQWVTVSEWILRFHGIPRKKWPDGMGYRPALGKPLAKGAKVQHTVPVTGGGYIAFRRFGPPVR